MIQRSHLGYVIGGIGITGLILIGIAVVIHNPFSTGVYAGDIRVSGSESGVQKLHQHLDTLKQSTFILEYKGKQKQVSFEELGIAIHRDQTIKTITQATSSSVWKDPLSILQTQKIDIAYTVRTPQLQKTLTTTFQPTLKNPQNARFVWEDNRLTVTPGKEGTTFNLTSIKHQLTPIINGHTEKKVLRVKLQNVPPDISREDLAQIHSRAASFITNQHVFAYADKSWEITPQQKKSWMTLEEQNNTTHIMFKKDQIRDYLQNTIAKDLNRDPHNAEIYFNPNKEDLTITEPGWEGRVLHTDLSLQQFLEDLRAGETQTDLVVNRPKPDVYQKNLHTLNISTKLGSGTTTFTGSSPSRVNNIRTSAAEMDGELVMPGEEFSFVNHLGPVTARTGYEPEMVIKNGQNVPEYGGGICQVSTTMFRSVMNTSLEITARQNHSYIIPMYGKPGFDATIYKPRPDFAFKNTTDSPILIQNHITGTRLTFSIYGAPNNKRAEVKGPYTLKRTDDGYTRTVVHRDVYNTKTGTRIDRDSFYSYYEPRNNFETVQAYE